jgi:nucleoside 2-deoxyribosyltransferase
MNKQIYLAGGLFNAGEMIHNLYLEKHLKLLGYEVILPQREGLKHFKNDKLDLEAIVKECTLFAMDRKNTYVGCIDGTDADSGTAVEYGLAIASKGKAIIYRTDFRTDFSKEIGVNAMFTGNNTVIIYEPAFLTELSQIDNFYENLAKRIIKAIESKS